jgi:hypothetical protein
MKSRNQFFFSLLILLGSIGTSYAQRSRVSSIMVFPHDQFCDSRGYTVEVKDPVSGMVTVLPDYNKALQKDSNLIQVISKISGIFANRGVPLVDLKATLDGIRQDRAEEAAVLAGAGKSVSKSPYDEVTEAARPDVAVYIMWSIQGKAPRRSIAFTIDVKDAYTRKVIASKSGTGEPSLTENTAALLAEAVITHVENLIADMQAYRETIETRGREIVLRVRVASDVDYNLESECNGKELSELIEDWMKANAKGGEYKPAKGTETRLEFTDVRIPLFKNEKAYDAKDFGKELMNYLKKTCPDKNNIKLQSRGLGGVDLYLGGKSK